MYKDLVNFYIAALDILSSKIFVLALVCDQLNQRLPAIVSNFTMHAALLRDRIGNATLELVTDIKKLLQDNRSKFPIEEGSRLREKLMYPKFKSCLVSTKTSNGASCTRSSVDFDPVMLVSG